MAERERAMIKFLDGDLKSDDGGIVGGQDRRWITREIGRYARDLKVKWMLDHESAGTGGGWPVIESNSLVPGS
jgi:hypothetical protein